MRRKSASRGDLAKRRISCAQHLGGRADALFQYEAIQRIPAAGLHAVEDHANRQIERRRDIRATQAVLEIVHHVLFESGKLGVGNSWLALVSSVFQMPRRLDPGECREALNLPRIDRQRAFQRRL